MRESVAVQYSHHATLSQRLAALRFPVFNPFFPMRRALSRAIGEAALGADGRVLDVGCGAKPYEHFFTSCTSYFGVDIEVSGHDHATSKIDAFFDGVNLPFADRSNLPQDQK